MNGFYEKRREDEGVLVVARNSNHMYPAHFHRNLEIFIVKKGGYRVRIGETSFVISAGTVAVIDAYEIHEYTDKDGMDTNDCVLLIPYDYITDFTARRRGKLIKNPVIQDGALVDVLLKIIDEYICNQSDVTIRRNAVNLLLSFLFPKLEFQTEKRTEESALVRNILSYIQEHYTGDVSRSMIARALGYTEAHISRTFHKYVKKGISEYVNELRLSHVERAIKNGDSRTVIELIYEAGFKSQQTYYRYRAKSRK